MKKFWFAVAIAAIVAGLLEWQRREIEKETLAWTQAGVDEI